MARCLSTMDKKLEQLEVALNGNDVLNTGKKHEEAVALLQTGGENIGQDPAGEIRETLAEAYGISTITHT